jgi:DNA-binding NarL/FixJ family response regulator
MLREPAVLSFLHSNLERTWSVGVPFTEPTADRRAAAVTDKVKRAIIRLLGTGVKDEVAARRLGISVRTCRRHIAEVMEELEATSRFQAGALAARAGLLDDRPAQEDTEDPSAGRRGG